MKCYIFNFAERTYISKQKFLNASSHLALKLQECSIFNFNPFDKKWPKVKCDNTQELDLETLIKRHWLRKLCLLHEIEKSTFLSYLFGLIPNMSWVHIVRNSNNLKGVNLKYGFFKNSFFPSVIMEQAGFENSWLCFLEILKKANKYWISLE